MKPGPHKDQRDDAHWLNYRGSNQINYQYKDMNNKSTALITNVPSLWHDHMNTVMLCFTILGAVPQWASGFSKPAIFLPKWNKPCGVLSAARSWRLCFYCVCRRWWSAQLDRWWRRSPEKQARTWAECTWGRSGWRSQSSWKSEKGWRPRDGKISHNSCFLFPLERTDLESNKRDLIVSLIGGAVTVKYPQSQNCFGLTPLRKRRPTINCDFCIFMAQRPPSSFCS